MLDTNDSLVQIKSMPVHSFQLHCCSRYIWDSVTSMTTSVFAIAATTFRLYLWRSRLWWDNAWAFFSLFCLLLQIVAVFMHIPHPCKAQKFTIPRLRVFNKATSLSIAELSQQARVAAYYLLAICFYGIIWCDCYAPPMSLVGSMIHFAILGLHACRFFFQ